MDGEDLPAPLFLAASCCGSHVVRSFLPGAQKPVGHQPLPWATEVWPFGLRGGGGGSSVVPPDGVAGGEDRDSVIPGRRSHRSNWVKAGKYLLILTVRCSSTTSLSSVRNSARRMNSCLFHHL